MNSERVPYLYSIIRLVPSIERGEVMNIGLVMFCRPHRFLRAEFQLDMDRIRVFAPGMDTMLVQQRAHTLALIATGDPAGGPVAALDIGERFHWLTNTSDTILQPGPVHTGLTVNAAVEFERLLGRLVAFEPPAP